MLRPYKFNIRCGCKSYCSLHLLHYIISLHLMPRSTLTSLSMTAVVYNFSYALHSRDYRKKDKSKHS